jgi:hypothetical protein
MDSAKNVQIIIELMMIEKYVDQILVDQDKSWLLMENAMTVEHLREDKEEMILV